MQKQLCWLLFGIIIHGNAFAQQEPDDVSQTQLWIADKILSSDTISRKAMPQGGYAALEKYLTFKISGADTVGKKIPIDMYTIGYSVKASGRIDTAYIRINHIACPVHNEIIKYLKETIWEPALVKGKPAPFESALYNRLYLTKKVLKKYNCWCALCF